jgi:hypothetical protein
MCVICGYGGFLYDDKGRSCLHCGDLDKSYAPAPREPQALYWSKLPNDKEGK